MWGSSFSDFAKKAQEAAEAATHLSNQAPSSFFNLDAMQQQTGDGEDQDAQHRKEPRVVEHYPSATTTTTTGSAATAAASSHLPAATPMMRPAAETSPVGKLKVPSSNSRSSGSPPISTAKETSPNEPPSPAKDKEEGEHDDAGRGSGWAEEDDVDVDDEQQGKGEQIPNIPDDDVAGEKGIVVGDTNEEEVEKSFGGAPPTQLEEEVAADGGPTTTEDSENDEQEKEAHKIADAEQQKQHQPRPLTVVADESSSHPATEGEDEIVVDPVSTAGSNYSNNNIDAVPEVRNENDDAVVEAVADEDGNIPIHAEKIETMERDMEPTTSTHEHSGAESIPQPQPQLLLPSMSTDSSAVAVPATPDSKTMSPSSTDRNKLLVLISSMPMNRQVQARQDLAETALKAAGVEFELADGVELKDLRNELFELSGLKGEYPQFFLVNLSNGGTHFWGNWDKFQTANDNGELLQEFGGSVSAASSPSSPSTPAIVAGSAAAVPDEILENFSNQIKRIEENHQQERAEMEVQHARALEAAGNHDACEAARAELEQRLTVELKTKEEQIEQLCRRNEGYRLKLDVLKREVTGTQELLQAKDTDAGKADQKHFNDLRAMEKTAMEAEARAKMFQDQASNLQGALETTRQELATAKEEHEDLKGRVKVVASELKDRRIECRELLAKIDELTDQNDNLRATVESLQENLNHQGMSSTEKDGEMEQLRAKLVDAELAMEKAQKDWKAQEVKNEQGLADYKKKAQYSLSMANSRTAAAVQAREEAELDARAARSTADSAFERATKAEIASREAVAEAKASAQAMKRERDRAMQELGKAEDELKAKEQQLANIKQQYEEAVSARDGKAKELENLRYDLNEVQHEVTSLQKQLTESNREVESLRRNKSSLLEQLKRAKAAADAAESSTKDSKQEDDAEMTNNDSSNKNDAAAQALQQELREANEAIEDLKEALKNAVEMNEDNAQSSSSPNGHHTSANGGETIPLFYAMEKQAELKTARDEMNRLASALADVQLEKTEAVEAMDEMRRRMEDAEARLKRFEKLGPAPSKSNSGAANIEYLKHIMLRFLNAKTTADRKALVPVIGAVLELTPEELQSAVKSVEETGSVSSSLFGLMSPR